MMPAPVRDESREHAFAAYSMLRQQGFTPSQIEAAAFYLQKVKHVEDVASDVAQRAIEACVGSMLDGTEMLEALERGLRQARETLLAKTAPAPELVDVVMSGCGFLVVPDVQAVS